MVKKQFHATDKGMSDEDWYSLVVEPSSGSLHIEHEWSHKASGALKWQSDRKIYTIDEFRTSKPNQFRKLLEFLEATLGGA